MKKILFACGVMLCCVGFAFANCNGDECSYDYNPDGIESNICEKKSLSRGDDCAQYKKGAKRAICINDKSCAAKECYDDNEHGNYLLWLQWDSSSNKYVSYGGCREISWLQDHYCKNNCECGSSDYTCKVVKRDLPPYLLARGLGGKGFYNDRVCECQKKDCSERYTPGTNAFQCCVWIEEKGRDDVQWDSGHTKCICKNGTLQSDGTCKEEETDECEEFPKTDAGKECCEKHKNDPRIIWDSENDRCACEGDLKLEDGKCVDKKKVKPEPTDCYYLFTTVQKCKNGKIIAKATRYPVDEEFMKRLNLGSCPDQERLQKLIEKDKELFDELVKKICAESDSPYVKLDESVGAAARIDAFMLSASSDRNLSVWKDAEGNFNTARLASDATAGVILGTVGGVVSAHVIKKKQLEKGFDALNCSVGGQKVADWGDEFSVGMRRY